MKKNEIIEVEIEKLAFGGDGIGHIDKKVVFVAGTVPGDKISARPYKIKKSFAHANLVEVIKPSELRIKARCKHFDICGGCSMQFIEHDQQLKIKAGQVKESISHIGGFKNPPMLPIIKCEDPWFYRNKMEFSFGIDERIDDGKIVVGLHPKGRRFDVFSVQECFLESKDTYKIVQAMQKFVRDHKLSSFHYKRNSGLLKSFIIREGKRTGERMIIIITSGEDFPVKDELVKLLTSGDVFKAPTSIYITKQVAKRGQPTTLEHELLHGSEHLTEKLILENGRELNFKIPPMAFFQPNTLQAEILYNTVIQLGEINKQETVYDLFCGTGTIGIFAANKAKKVIGIDINKHAIESAKSNAQLNKIDNIEFEAGDAYKTIKQYDHKPQTIIVDPPRSGLGNKVCKFLNNIKTHKLIYVSCNPTTLARDLKALCRVSYRLITVQPVDMFPHTHHVETVCKLKLRSWLSRTCRSAFNIFTKT